MSSFMLFSICATYCTLGGADEKLDYAEAAYCTLGGADEKLDYAEAARRK